jgi:hypothetical protein
VPCDIVGEPAPNVTWYRDAEPLGDIPAVRYTVLTNNSLHIRYGTVSEAVQLFVKGKIAGTSNEK